MCCKQDAASVKHPGVDAGSAEQPQQDMTGGVRGVPMPQVCSDPWGPAGLCQGGRGSTGKMFLGIV